MHIVLQYLHFAVQKQMHGCIAYTNQGVETLPRAQVFSSLWFCFIHLVKGMPSYYFS